MGYRYTDAETELARLREENTKLRTALILAEENATLRRRLEDVATPSVRWEYIARPPLHIAITSDQPQLNSLGEQSWELAVESGDNWIFKRPKRGK